MNNAWTIKIGEGSGPRFLVVDQGLKLQYNNLVDFFYHLSIEGGPHLGTILLECTVLVYSSLLENKSNINFSLLSTTISTNHKTALYSAGLLFCDWLK